MIARFRFRWLMPALGAAACGGEPLPLDPYREAVPRVTLTADRTTVSPGGYVEFTLRAEPQTSAPISRLEITFRDLFDTTHSLPVGGPGAIEYLVSLQFARVPVEGTLEVQAAAWVGESRGESRALTVNLRDGGPPEVLIYPIAGAEPGTSTRVDYWISDDSGLERVQVRTTGAVQYSEARTLEYQSALGGQIPLTVPAAARLGDSIELRVIAIDMFAKADTAVLGVAVTDLTPPRVTGEYDTVTHAINPFHTPLFLPGDTIRLTVRAEDERRLSWIGYRIPILGLADSVPVAVPADTVQFLEIAGAPSVDATFHPIALFARDSVGNEALATPLAAFADAIEYPVTSNPTLPQFLHWAYDAARHRLLVAPRGDSSVLGVSLTTGAVVATAALPGPVGGMDLSLSGDSLLVAMPDRAALGVIRLDGGGWQVDSLPLPNLGYPKRAPTTLRVGAGGRILVITGSQSMRDTTAYVVDLASGQQALRADIGWGGSLERSGDRQVILYRGGDGDVLYRPQTDVFERPGNIVPQGPPSLDSTGGRVLVGNRLHDGFLRPVLDFVTELGFWGSSLNPGGGAAYFAMNGEPYYRRFSTADGSLLERVLLPNENARILTFPGDSLLVATCCVTGMLIIRRTP